MKPEQSPLEATECTRCRRALARIGIETVSLGSLGTRDLPIYEQCDCVDLRAAVVAADDRVKKISTLNPIYARFRDVSMAKLTVDADNLDAAKTAGEFVTAMAEKPSGADVRGFGLYGKRGCGKTTLAFAAVNALRSAGIPAMAFTVAGLLRTIAETFGNDERNRILFRAVVETPALILDDLGKEHVGEDSWSATQFYEIVNERYLRTLPIVVTTNFDPVALDAHFSGNEHLGAILDRIQEMIDMRWVRCGGINRRLG